MIEYLIFRRDSRKCFRMGKKQMCPAFHHTHTRTHDGHDASLFFLPQFITCWVGLFQRINHRFRCFCFFPRFKFYNHSACSDTLVKLNSFTKQAFAVCAHTHYTMHECIEWRIFTTNTHMRDDKHIIKSEIQFRKLRYRSDWRWMHQTVVHYSRRVASSGAPIQWWPNQFFFLPLISPQHL